jgi:hypothetical protein
MNKFLTLRLVIYLAVALAIRLILYFNFPALLTGDSSGYLVASYHVYHAADFSDISQRAVMLPGYPVFLALTAPLTHMSSANIVLLQKSMGLLSLWLGFGIGHLLRSRYLGEALFLFLGLNPVFLVYEHTLSTETLFIFLLLLLTFTWLLWLKQQQTILTGGLLGLLLGLAVLTRANGLIFGGTLVIGGICLLLVNNNQTSWPSRLKKVTPTLIGMMIGLSLLLIPWSGIFFLTVVRPFLGLLSLAAILAVLLTRPWRFSERYPNLDHLFVIGFSYLATVTTHILTLTTNDRYTTPFDWVLVLLLVGSLYYLVDLFRAKVRKTGMAT